MSLSQVPIKLEGEGTGVPGNFGFDHMGIVVHNAQASAEFLMDVFDAEFDWEVRREERPTAGERGWDKLFGVHPDSFMPHVLMLRCGEQPLTQYIELFEWRSPDQAHADPSSWPKFSDVGFAYLSFSVRDMGPVVEHIHRHVYPKYPGSQLCQDPPMSFPLRGDVCTSTFLKSGLGFWVEITSWEQGRLAAREIRAQRARGAHHESIGKSIFTLSTPALLVDVDAMHSNARTLRDRCRQRNVQWRTVVKAHRAPGLARWLCAEDGGGANGIVLLSLAECEAFAARRRAECPGVHVYLANEVPREQIPRLALVSRALDDQLRVAVDSLEYATALSEEICRWEIPHPVEVLLEFDIGHHRCGCDLQDAESFSRACLALPGLRVVGVTGYEGHTPVLAEDAKRQATLEAHDILRQAAEAARRAGVDVQVISAGGSCNYIHALEAGVVNELQAGGGVFGDRLYQEKGGLEAHGHQPAVFILSSVMSVHKGRAMADAGFKKIGLHPFSPLPRPRDFDPKDVEVVALSAEHLRMRTSTESSPLAYGDKLVIHPGYLDSYGFLHKRIYGIRNDEVVDVWETLNVE